MKHFSLRTKGLKGISYGTILRPSRDWLLLLALALICLLVSVGWNLWTFDTVTEGGAVGADAPVQEPGTASLDSVTRLFEARALEEARYKNEYRFVDPSGGAR